MTETFVYMSPSNVALSILDKRIHPSVLGSLPVPSTAVSFLGCISNNLKTTDLGLLGRLCCYPLSRRDSFGTPVCLTTTQKL